MIRAFKAAVILFCIGMWSAWICGAIIAASDNIAYSRKKAEQVRQYNASIEAMTKIQKEMPR